MARVYLHVEVKTAVKPVIQLEPTGCGIASAAAISGLTYPRAKAIANRLGIFAHDESLWSDTTHVPRLLRHLGMRPAPRPIPFRTWTMLPDLALLAIKWHRVRNRPSWHWVVFVRRQGHAVVLDSKKGLRTHRRTDFGRMRPKWFIPVTVPIPG